MACVLTFSAWALAYCPYPDGSVGGNGWNGGLTQGYFKDFQIGGIYGDDKWVMNWCTIGTTNCSYDVIDWHGKTHFTPRNGYEWHGSQAFPLRSIAIYKTYCGLPGENKWCIDFSGDVDAGDHINYGQNAISFYISGAVPTNLTDPTYISAPAGHQIVKIAGMASNPYQTLRINYVNSTNTAIATKDVFWYPMSCP
jgi:hypothetical protein